MNRDEILEVGGVAFALSDIDMVGRVEACDGHEVHNHAGGIAHLLIVIKGMSVIIDLDGYMTGVATRKQILNKWAYYKCNQKQGENNVTKNQESI